MRPTPPSNEKNQEFPIQYTISSIKLTKSELYFKDSLKIQFSDSLSYWFEAAVNLLTGSSIIQIVICYQFFCNGELLLEMEVVNDYKIENKASIFKDGKLTDKDFLLFLIELSMGHHRGMQALLIEDTPLNGFFIPFLSSNQIAEKIKNDDSEIIYSPC